MFVATVVAAIVWAVPPGLVWYLCSPQSFTSKFLTVLLMLVTACLSMIPAAFAWVGIAAALE